MRTAADCFTPPPDPVAELAQVNMGMIGMGLQPARGDEPGLAPDILAAMQRPANRLRLALMLFGHFDMPGQCYVARAKDEAHWQWDIQCVPRWSTAPDGWQLLEKVSL
jgi:hypothetical protein